MLYYSGTSDALRKGQPPNKGHTFPIAVVFSFNLQEEENLSMENKIADIKVSFLMELPLTVTSMARYMHLLQLSLN